MKLKINETEIKLDQGDANASFQNSRQYESVPSMLSYELSINGIYLISDIFKILDSAFRNGDFVKVYAIHGNFELKIKMAVVTENICNYENNISAFYLVGKDELEEN